MDYKELAVADTSDLRDGEMKEVSAGGARILLARVGGDFRAVGAACPHYGAPLSEGALCSSTGARRSSRGASQRTTW